MSLWFGQGGTDKLARCTSHIGPCVTGCRTALSDPYVEEVEVGMEDAEEDSWEMEEVDSDIETGPTCRASLLSPHHVTPKLAKVSWAERVVDIDAHSFIVDIDGCTERQSPVAKQPDQHLELWCDYEEEIYDFDEMQESPIQSCTEREDSLLALVNELVAPMQAEGGKSVQKEKVGTEESWALQAEQLDQSGEEEEDDPEQQDRFESEEDEGDEEAVLSAPEAFSEAVLSTPKDITLASADAAELSSEHEGRSPPPAAKGFDWIVGSASRVITPPTEAVDNFHSQPPAEQSNPFLSMRQLDFSSIPDNFTEELAIGAMSPAAKEACERAAERMKRISEAKCLQDPNPLQCIGGVYGQQQEKLKRELSHISEGTTDEAWSSDDEDVMWPTTDTIDFDDLNEEDAEDHMENQVDETKVQEEPQEHSAQPIFSSLSHPSVFDSMLSDEEILARFPVVTPAAGLDSCGCMQGLLKLGGSLTPRGTSKTSEQEHEAPASALSVQEAPAKSASPDSSSSTDLSIDEDELKSMLSQSRADLVTLCQCRGLPSNGSKSDLAHRLSSVLQ